MAQSARKESTKTLMTREAEKAVEKEVGYVDATDISIKGMAIIALPGAITWREIGHKGAELHWMQQTFRSEPIRAKT